MQHYSKSKGITLIELIIALAVILSLSTFLLLIIRPQILYSETRDKVRISDLTTLERIVIETQVDTQAYPGTVDTTYYSNTLPSGAVGPVDNISQGWLGVTTNLTKYYSKLPLDPTNDSTYRYIYRHNGDSYELNVRLESNTELMTSDGGDDDTYYELGNDLTLL